MFSKKPNLHRGYQRRLCFSEETLSFAGTQESYGYLEHRYLNKALKYETCDQPPLVNLLDPYSS